MRVFFFLRDYDMCTWPLRFKWFYRTYNIYVLNAYICIRFVHQSNIVNSWQCTYTYIYIIYIRFYFRNPSFLKTTITKKKSFTFYANTISCQPLMNNNNNIIIQCNDKNYRPIFVRNIILLLLLLLLGANSTAWI